MGGVPGWLPADLAVPEAAGAACLLCRLSTLPSAYVLSPIPPPPFPSGEGGDFLFSYARGFAPCIPGTEPERHGDRGANHAPGGGACLPCCRLTLPLWYPGGEDEPQRHLFALPRGRGPSQTPPSRQRRIVPSPPVPPLLGWRHCSPEPRLNCHAPSGYRNATLHPVSQGAKPHSGHPLGRLCKCRAGSVAGMQGAEPLA